MAENASDALFLDCLSCLIFDEVVLAGDDGGMLSVCLWG